MLMRSPGRFRRQLSGCSMTTERDHFRGLSPRRPRVLRLGAYGEGWFDFLNMGKSGGSQQIQYDQQGRPIAVTNTDGGGGFWSEVTKGATSITATIADTVSFIAHPQEYAAGKQAEAAAAQAWAAGQGYATQIELARMQNRARTMRWLIGGAVLIGGGLVFARVLRRA